MMLASSVLCASAIATTVSASRPLADGVVASAEKPTYTVSIDARNVAYELRVNDIPVFSKTDDMSSLNSKVPINPWLIPGRNTFSIRILPAGKSKTDPNDPKYVRVVVTGPKAGGTGDADVARAEAKPAGASGPGKVGSQESSFDAVLGFPAPAWTASAKIGKDAATQKVVLEKYREFHRLLKTKNVDGLMKFSAAKFAEYAQALYDPSFVKDRRESFVRQFAAKADLIDIEPQQKNGLRYEYYYGDRLVSIKNDEDRSIIMYYDDASSVTTQYPLFFYFDGKNYVLIR